MTARKDYDALKTEHGKLVRDCNQLIERNDSLRERVALLTKERDEAIQARDVWHDQATRHDQFNPRALGERAVAAESRLDELRRVVAELVRK